MTAEVPTAAPLDTVLTAAAQAERLLVCCDFDGTLSTLADEPMAARPVDGAVAALDTLAGMADTWTAVVSGRSLIDLTQLAGMPDRVHLVGSHGNEFEVGRILAVNPTNEGLLEQIIAACHEIAGNVPGVYVETKPASVAVHVRRVAADVGERLLDRVRSGPGRLPGVHLLEGKQVVEIAVFAGSKGGAVRVLRDRWGITTTLFVGDDVTDESGFAALGPGDVAIKVGDGSSLAPWRLADPAAVVDVLVRLALARSPMSRPARPTVD